MESQKDTVVIVGGGPVGLWIAIQLKLLNEKQIVIVFEKRTTYVREHILKLKIKNMETPKIKNQEFEELKKKISGKTPTKLLETELSNFAEKQNVKVIKGESILNLQDIYKHVPEKNIIALLGCDGRRSTVRTVFMEKYKNGDKLPAFSSLWYPIMYPMNFMNRNWTYKLLCDNPKIDEQFNMIQEQIFLNQLMLKYTIQGKGQSLSKMEIYKTLKLLPFPATEIVGKYNQVTDRTEATCIFIIDQQTINDVKNFTPQKPGKFNLLFDKVKECVNIWMNAKQELVKQVIVEDSERLVYVPISVYCACDFINLKNSFPIALVGDAAYGVPYFRALNTSLECGTEISQLINELVQKKKKPEDQFKQYQKYMAEKVYTLFSQSSLKSHQYQSIQLQYEINQKFGMSTFVANSKVPWQFIKWSDGEFKRKLYKNFDPHHEESVDFNAIDLDNQKPEDYGIDPNEIHEPKQEEQKQQ